MDMLNQEKAVASVINLDPTNNNTTAKKVRTTIYLPVDLHKDSKIYCARNGISLTQLVINYLNTTVQKNNS